MLHRNSFRQAVVVSPTGLRPDDRTTEVRVPRPGYRDVADVFGRDHRLVGCEEVGRDSGVERDEVDLPAATVVGPVTGGDTGDSKLAGGAVGHVVEGIGSAPGRDRTRRHNRPDDRTVVEELALSCRGHCRQGDEQGRGSDNRSGEYCTHRALLRGSRHSPARLRTGSCAPGARLVEADYVRAGTPGRGLASGPKPRFCRAETSGASDSGDERPCGSKASHVLVIRGARCSVRFQSLVRTCGQNGSMETVLVVDDEPTIRDVVVKYLRREGFATLEAGDGDAARELLEREWPSLVVLDLMLPGTDGLALCRWIRERSQLPVIMLTARGEEADRIVGLELGADDYVTKPFSPRELVARVRTVLRRGPAANGAPEERVRFGDIEIDAAAHEVRKRGSALKLTAREFDLLLFLARHPRRVFSRDQLMSRVWGYEPAFDSGTITVHVRRLREKIEDEPARPRYLETIWGVGYRLSP